MTKRTALLVDDDPNVRWTVAMILDELGFAVTQTDGPHEALAVVGNGDVFDILVTDVVMPGMDGWTLAEQIRAKCPALPVVYVTGFSTDTTRPVEHSRILWKPFTEKTIARALTELLLSGRTLPEA
jgi:CheY-like chemotaxis protein